jgi:two-component system, chemotaxis family, protein-glutamate methylesterase/glutaminase
MEQHPVRSQRGPPPFFVAIGASGSEGLGDIKELLASLPAGLQAVVLVVLHRPSDRVSALRDVLDRASGMPVLVAEEDRHFRMGRCYIGEPDAHLALAARSRIELVEGAHGKHRNRTVDILFHSVARHAGSRAIGIVLSGSLDDGARGLAAIHGAGGTTMILTRGGEPEPGMPLSAAKYDGPVDLMGSARQLGRGIADRVQ